MQGRIYKPAKSATQSGKGKTKDWVLEFEQEKRRDVEPLMGWTSTTETMQQVRLSFDTKDEAIAYAQKNGIPYRVLEPAPAIVRKASYADNFRYGRVGSWTH
jgi:hypothetical protein